MTPTAEIAVIEQSELIKKPLTLLDQVNKIVIITNEDRITAESYLQDLASAYDKRFAYLDPPRENAWVGYKYHKQRLDDAIEGIEAAKKALKQKCINWDDDQERIRQKLQRQAEEEARKRAEEEALAAALQAEQEGDKATADAILAEPIAPAPVIVPKTAPAPSRLSAGRDYWYASVVNIKALCYAIGVGSASSEFVMGLDKDKKTDIISSPALNKLATALKQTMNVAGVEAKSKKV